MLTLQDFEGQRLVDQVNFIALTLVGVRISDCCQLSLTALDHRLCSRPRDAEHPLHVVDRPGRSGTHICGARTALAAVQQAPGRMALAVQRRAGFAY